MSLRLISFQICRKGFFVPGVPAEEILKVARRSGENRPSVRGRQRHQVRSCIDLFLHPGIVRAAKNPRLTSYFDFSFGKIEITSQTWILPYPSNR